MRRLLPLTIGILQLALATVLVLLGASLPATEEVDHTFANANRVAADARSQLHILHRQVQDLRRPELLDLAFQLRSEARTITAMLKEQQLDFDTVAVIRDSLADMAEGFDGLAGTLDPQAIARLGDLLGDTATFLEDKVVPAADQAAAQLDQSADALQADAKRLGTLLRNGPVDLKATREMYDGLGRFTDGLDAINTLLKKQRLESVREGVRSMEMGLTDGADQVGKMADFSYPVVKFKGVWPKVTQAPLWPEGRRIADGLREAAAGAGTVGQDADELAVELPRVCAALNDCQKGIAGTRKALGIALERQEQITGLLQDAPAHAARLAEDLPRLGKDLSTALRDTGRLREVARGLRQARQGIDALVTHWPELRRGLTRSARMLRSTGKQLQTALDHRQDYQAVLQQSIAMAESFAALLPLLTDQLDSRLEEEEASLADLDRSLLSVQDSLPAYGRTATNVVVLGRWLAWLGAAVVALHGVSQLLKVNRTTAASARPAAT